MNILFRIGLSNKKINTKVDSFSDLKSISKPKQLCKINKGKWIVFSFYMKIYITS